MQKKILVITDKLPSKQMTAGYVLSLIHRELRLSYDVFYVCIHDFDLKYDVFEEIGSQSVYIIEQPRESWAKQGPRFFSKVHNFIGEITSGIDSSNIAKKIKTIIHRENPEKIIYVIESKTSVRVGWKLLKEIKIESLGIYWDPIVWWIESKKTNRVTKKSLINKNIELIRSFSHIIVPSNNMKHYMNNLGAKKITTLYPYYNN